MFFSTKRINIGYILYKFRPEWLPKDLTNNSNNNGLTKPHELLVKATLSNPKAIQDFANIYFPKTVLEKMDHSSLKLTNKSYVSADMKEFHDDVVFSFTLES